MSCETIYQEALAKTDKQMALIEKLAELEHEQWALIKESTLDNLTPENIERWRRQIATKYSDLSEQEKDSDREWAEKIYELFEESGLIE